MNTINLRGVSFLGPHKETTSIHFSKGNTVIYGASDTGKSFILQTVQFFLGGSSKIKDIRERVGYDICRVALETSSGTITAERHVNGGNISLYLGDQLTSDTSLSQQILTKPLSKKDFQSSYLTGVLGLNNKFILKSSTQKTSISFRQYSAITIIPFAKIQSSFSPVQTGQYSDIIEYNSFFRFLLTGIEDSKVEITSKNEIIGLKSIKKYIEKNISEQAKDFPGEINKQSLENSISILNKQISDEDEQLSFSTDAYNALISEKQELEKQVAELNKDTLEYEDLISNFTLLQAHYQSDIDRLEAIINSGQVINTLSDKPCDVCGALPANQLNTNVDKNEIDLVIKASESERNKIRTLSQELSQLLKDIFVNYHEKIKEKTYFMHKLSTVNTDIKEKYAPLLRLKRKNYSKLVTERELSKKLLEQLNRIDKQKNELEKTNTTLKTSKETQAVVLKNSSSIPRSVLSELSNEIRSILKDWDYPYSDDISFDTETMDIILNGRLRGSQGQGLLAITHAAFTIGLMIYCLKNNLPHPGFVILDSPLLAYREPESEEAKLLGKNLEQNFYKYISELNLGQAIIIENKGPLPDINKNLSKVFFTGDKSKGRYGFFPIQK